MINIFGEIDRKPISTEERMKLEMIENIAFILDLMIFAGVITFCIFMWNK